MDIKKESRNQKRQREYAAMAATSRGDGSRRARKRSALKARRAVRIVGTRGPHVEPCGNPACISCHPREARR